MTIHEALYAVLREVQDIAATKVVNTGSFTYRYVDLGDVLAEVKRACALHDLALSQALTEKDGRFGVVTMIVSAAGEVLEFPITTIAAPTTPQALGSAATYLRRYSLMAIFGIATEDDDGAAASKPAVVDRSPEETVMRKILAGLDSEAFEELRDDFQGYFGTTLRNLEVARHAEALAWLRERIADES